MTEAEWVACTDPRKMLGFLQGKASERRLRLFACAYYRAVRDTSHLGPGTAVTLAEQYADGLASAEELAAKQRATPLQTSSQYG